MNKKIFQQATKNIEANKHCWLATVIHAAGSTPGRIGMKMLVNLDGELDGTIGGGAIENKVINKIKNEKPTKTEKWSFDLNGNSTFEKTGMICGGIQEILIDPLHNHHELYIIGGGHCGKALTELASKCNFSVTIIDDRPEITVKEQHPFAANVICSPYHGIEKHIPFSPNIFIVAMTHGHKHDQLVMEKIVREKYKYFGVIGSKNKVQTCFKQLQDKGFSKEKLQKIYSPIGLKIGSQTPMEVAISIMAQMMAVKNGIEAVEFNSNPLL